MNFYYNKKTKQLKMISEKELEVDSDIYGVITKTPTKAERVRLDTMVTKIERGKFVFRDFDPVEKERRLKILNATTVAELKEALLK